MFWCLVKETVAKSKSTRVYTHSFYQFCIIMLPLSLWNIWVLKATEGNLFFPVCENLLAPALFDEYFPSHFLYTFVKNQMNTRYGFLSGLCVTSCDRVFLQHSPEKLALLEKSSSPIPPHFEVVFIAMHPLKFYIIKNESIDFCNIDPGTLIVIM